LPLAPNKILTLKEIKIIFGHECIDVTMDNPTCDDLAKTNAFIFNRFQTITKANLLEYAMSNA
jgi:hypothetical protein